MAILPTPSVDYSDFDFDSIRARLYNLISVAYPDWTEQAVANFGNLLIELTSFTGDVLGFYLDARARESRLTLARQRQSVVALAKLLNYAPAGATAATTDVLFTLAQPNYLADVQIPSGTLVRTPEVRDPIVFQTVQAGVVSAGQTTVILPVEHSAGWFETFPATGFANQEVRLSNTPYLDASEAIDTQLGAFTRVDNFLGSASDDLHYTISVDQYERAILRFGNGTNGAIPSGTIEVRYKTGGGAAGNLEPNALRKVDSVITDDLGNPVQIAVTNPVEARGGSPRKSRAQIQVEAPQRLRALTRTVAREDYEINARRVSGVARALMLTRNQVPAIRENAGQLFVVPAGGGRPSGQMLDDVLEMVTVSYPNTITFHVDVLPAEYLVVNIQATVFLRKGVAPKAADTAIRAALAKLFALNVDEGTEDERDNPDVNFGFYAAQTSEGTFDGVLALSDIANAIRDVSGIRKLGDGFNDLLVNGAHRDLIVQAHQFPRLGTVVVLNGETDALLSPL